MTRYALLWLVTGLLLGLLAPAGSTHGADAAAPALAAAAQQILDATGVKGGLIVHLGCGDGRLTAALGAGESYLVHGLDADPKNVEAARAHIRSLGLYGKVSVEARTGGGLPYIDNLVNLVVISDSGSQISEAEVMRVLAPGGVAYVKAGGQWSKTVKPRPKEIDEWTHYLHDPGNNAVAHDSVVGPPRHLQWVGTPSWSRHHDHMASMSALVSANGRIFYIMDEGPRDAILLPSKWMLVARDAFSGTILWKRPIPEWNTSLWPLKSGPNQLPRRLVAVGDRVYVTLGIDAPLSVLDAATGRTVRALEGTQYTEEILAADGVLYLLAAQSPNKWKEYRPKFTYVWDNTSRANRDWAWDQEPRFIMAVQADTGNVLWKREQRVAPLTLALDAERVYFYDGEKAVSLNRKSGKEAWASEPIVRKQPFPTGYGPTLVVEQGVVLVSVENPAMTALAAADGKKLWASEHHKGGHASPDDMLVVSGLVWSGAIAAGADSGVLTGRDIRTGEVKSEFAPDIKAYWFHHRCYRARATDQYFISSRTGVEFIDLAAKHWSINHWVRGGCLYGIMPANGLVYAPPHSCGCYLESKLFGFNALAAESPTRKVPRDVPDTARLVRGPAYEEAVQAAAAAADEWPTYRHDGARSGSAKTAVPVADLKRVWETPLGGKLSSVVVAGGKVFVAAVDRHAVHALDAGSGKQAWSFTAGGRIDSPPTIWQGRVIFGSADGWVYCLRADDGRLIWRFQGGPADRRLTAYEQLESAWPVSGAVLVQGDAVYCIAGRSAFLDGGMRLVRLDPKTGRKTAETIIDDRDPETGEDLQTKMKGLDMPVALPDVLSCDGKQIYMRAQAFDLEGVRQGVAPIKDDEAPTEGAHLFSRSGFLDDSWFFRSYWIYGKGVSSGYGSWFRPGHFAPSGRLIVFDDACAYGFDRKPEYLCNASVQEYYLYAADRQVTEEGVKRVQAATGRINAASASKAASASDWAVRKKFSLSEQSAANFKWAEGDPPILARAMVLAGKTLFVAGPPDVVDEEEAITKPDDPVVRAKLEAQVAALEGRKGGRLLAFSAADGKQLAAVELGAMPTFDGMAAAKGRLYLATADGKVLCLGAGGAAMPAAPDARLVPIDTSVKTTTPEPPPGAAAGPSAAREFAQVTRAKVTQSSLGYSLHADDKKMGLALKKLPTPATGKVNLKVRMKLRTDGKLKNGFLVFGDSPEDAALVKCGLRSAMKKAVIVEGPLAGGTSAAEALDIDNAKTYDIDVTVDLASGQVTMKVGGATVTATLARRPANVSYVGYGASDAAADFSAVEVSGG
jgi:outer membrane protein assembly factor BamB